MALLSLGCAFTRFHFLSSPRTPFSLQEVVERAVGELGEAVEVRIEEMNEREHQEFASEDVLFDYTYSSTLAAELKTSGLKLVTMWQKDPGDQHNRYEKVLTEYVTAFNFTRVRLITDTNEAHLRSVHYLKTHFPGVYEDVDYTVSEGLAQTEALQFTGEVIKPSGATLFALFTTPSTTAMLLAAFQAKKLNKAGYAFLLSDTARYLSPAVLATVPLAAHGLLAVARKESCVAVSREEGEAAILAKVLHSFPLIPEADYCLMNMQNSRPILVASSPESTISTVVFPGNSTAFPSSAIVHIPISINSQFIKSDGSLFALAPIIMRGFSVAVEEANDRTDLLPHFSLLPRSVSLSGLIFNSSFTQHQVLAYRNQIGLVHFAMPLGHNVIATFAVLQALNASFPMMTGTLSDALTSSSDFPLYLRTRTGNRYLANVIAQVFKFFHWTRIAVLYAQDRADFEEAYNRFLDYTEELELNITNSPDMRALTFGITTPEQLAHLNASIQHIRHTDVRIILLFTSDVIPITEAMYDLGIRSEYLLLFITSLSSTLFSGTDISAYKRRIVAKGALQFFPRLFIGKAGQEVLRLLIEKDGLGFFPNGCLYYDCAMLYVHATDYMINRGIDYEDRDEIMKAMRSTHFKGCTGTIAIGTNSNEPSDQIYSLMNSQYSPDTDSLEVKDVFYFNPFSVTLIEAVGTVQWPDDSQSMFLDTLVYSCPFPDSDVSSFAPGLAVAYSVCCGMCVYTAVLGVFIWCLRFNKVYPVLTEKRELSLEDTMMLMIPLIDFFQLVSMSPSPTSIDSNLNWVFALATLNLHQGFKAAGSLHWLVLHWALGLSSVLILVYVVRLTKLEKKMKYLYDCTFVCLFVSLVLPTASNWFTLPLVSVLVKIYFCTKATGNSFSSSFLDSDCFEGCWSGSHIAFLVGCSVVLLAYISVTIFSCPIWQEQQPSLHIRTQPLPLLVKTVLQIVLAILYQCLAFTYPDAHICIFLGFVSVYFLFLLRYPLFNYSR